MQIHHQCFHDGNVDLRSLRPHLISQLDAALWYPVPVWVVPISLHELMIPRIPSGATVRSILSVHYAVGKSVPLMRRKISLVLLGFGAADTLETFLKAGMPKEAILNEHTLAPLLFAMQSELGSSELLKFMIQPPKSVPKALIQLEFARSVRRCPSCVQLDLRTGFAFSRVGHQIPAVVTCLEHGVPLEECCLDCGKPFSLIQMHAGAQQRGEQIASCKSCGCSLGRSLTVVSSPGYTAFCELVAAALTGNAPLLVAPHRFTVIEHAAQVAERLGLDILAEFSAFWNASSPSQAAALCNVDVGHVKRCFSLRMFPFAVNLVITAVSLAIHILRKGNVEYLGVFSPLIDWSLIDHNDQLARELAVRAVKWGMPTRAAAKLAAGVTTTSVRSVLRLPPSMLNKFLESLPPEHYQALQRRQEASTAARTRHANSPEDFRASRRAEALALMHGLSPAKQAGRSNASRPVLLREAPRVYAWLRENDRAWLDQNFPKIKFDQPSWYTSSAKPSLEHALAALESGDYKSVPDLKKRRETLFTWLFKNYPDVLRARLADSRTAQTAAVSSVRLEAKRATVLQMIDLHKLGKLGFPSSANIGAIIETKNSSIRKWFLIHDRAWFSEHVHANKRMIIWKDLPDVIRELRENFKCQRPDLED